MGTIRLAVNARFLTQQVTGVQRYAREMTKEVTRLLGPEDMRLIAPRAAPPEFGGSTVFRCGGFAKGHVWEQVVLPRAVMDSGVDILFSPGNSGSLLVKNQVVVIHDVAVFVRPSGYSTLFAEWYRFLLPRLAARVQRVITVSEFSRREIVEYLGVSPNKVVVIPSAVSRHFVPMEERTISAFKINKKLPERFVLALASRSRNKNFQGILKAWQRLCNDQPEISDVWLVVAGGVFRTLKADGLSEGLEKVPRVRDLGYVDDEDLPSLYGAAEAFVFPSFYEGFGLPPLEAMACGTPVVVSNAASLPEVVGDAAIYVNPHDTEDIAAAIYRVLSEPALRQFLREKGLARAKLFTWEKSAKETLKVFEEVLREQRRC